MSPQVWAASQWTLRSTDDFSMWIWYNDKTKYLRHSSSGTSSASSFFQSLGKPHQHLCGPSCLFHLTLVDTPEAKKAKKQHCASSPLSGTLRLLPEAVQRVSPKRAHPLSASLGDASVTLCCGKQLIFQI